MMRGISMLGGIGLGAGLMCFLDPARGRRRRALVRDKFSRAGHRLDRGIGKARRDMEKRAAGFATQSQRAVERVFTGNPQVDDDILALRVRSRIGRSLRHPHAVEVNARCGVVTLKGDVSAAESDEVLAETSSIPGVVQLENRLKVRDEESGAEGPRQPALSNWTPALRAVIAAGGGALAVYGAVKRGVLGGAAGVTGAAMLTRAVTNKEFKRIVGWDGCPSVDVQKTANIHAPVNEVFSFLTDFTNLPRFMAHLREVRDLGSGCYHWVAAGPAGVPVAWDAEVDKLVPGKLVEWRSLPGSVMASKGSIRFDENPDGGTRITVRMSYKPPAGMIGHTVASLFGADPKSQLDDDFVRLKSLIETGRTRVHGRVVTHHAKPGGVAPSAPIV